MKGLRKKSTKLAGKTYGNNNGDNDDNSNSNATNSDTYYINNNYHTDINENNEHVKIANFDSGGYDNEHSNAGFTGQCLGARGV